LLAHHAHRLKEIGIVGNEYRRVVHTPIAITEQMRSQIDIGTLFLGLDDLGRPRALGRRVYQAHTDMAGQKVPQDDVKMRDRTQGAEIDLLSSRLVRIVW